MIRRAEAPLASQAGGCSFDLGQYVDLATHPEIGYSHDTERKSLLQRRQVTGLDRTRQMRQADRVAIAVEQAHAGSELSQTHAGECGARSDVRLDVEMDGSVLANLKWTLKAPSPAGCS